MANFEAWNQTNDPCFMARLSFPTRSTIILNSARFSRSTSRPGRWSSTTLQMYYWYCSPEGQKMKNFKRSSTISTIFSPSISHSLSGHSALGRHVDGEHDSGRIQGGARCPLQEAGQAQQGGNSTEKINWLEIPFWFSIFFSEPKPKWFLKLQLESKLFVLNCAPGSSTASTSSTTTTSPGSTSSSTRSTRNSSAAWSDSAGATVSWR